MRPAISNRSPGYWCKDTGEFNSSLRHRIKVRSDREVYIYVFQDQLFNQSFAPSFYSKMCKVEPIGVIDEVGCLRAPETLEDYCLSHSLCFDGL